MLRNIRGKIDDWTAGMASHEYAAILHESETQCISKQIIHVYLVYNKLLFIIKH